MANDIGSSINTYLLAQSAIKAIVADRGTPDVLPQDAVYPAYTYTAIGDTPSHHMGGVSGLRQAYLQFTCYAETRKAANQLDEAILAELDMEGGGSYGDTPVRTVQAQDRYTDADEPINGSGKWRYIALREYLIWYIP